MVMLMIAVLLCGSAVALGCAVYGALKLNHIPLERYVRYAMISCAIAVSTNAFAIMMPTKMGAYLLFGVYHILADITVAIFFVFALRYLGNNKKLSWLHNIFVLLTIIDCVLMLINPFKHIIFSVDVVHGNDEHFYRISSYAAGYLFHAVFLLSLIFTIIVLLALKIYNTSKSYILRYVTVLISLLLIVTLNLCHIAFELKYDYSLIFYPILAFLIYFYSMIYVPRGLMDRLVKQSFASMKDGMVSIDIDNKIVFSNSAARNYAESDDSVVNLDKQVRKWLAEMIEPDESFKTWDDVRTIEGKDHYFTLEYSRICDEADKYLGSFFSIHNRTEEYTKYYAERYRATHDALTGLYNKERFYDCAREILGENPDVSYIMIMTDIKNFKMVNDVFGVEAGDAMLKRVADITRTFGGEGCVYSRITNDRFAILMPQSRFDESELLERYSVIDSFLSNSAFKTHIHIGVYEIDDRSVRISVMCDRANLAIKKIKDSYRSFVAYYDDDLRKSFISEHKVISEFDKAIADGQIRAYIQPQIAADGHITGGEALVRWIHPKDGMIPPFKFIGLFEQTGLIGRLDRHMWEIACNQLRQWSESNMNDTYISVNISQKDFYLLDVYKVLTELVEKYEIEPRRLHLEITETALMNNPKEQLEIISRLRRFGFMVEIDDFGSGYSSLNMLKELDADVLKIDMGFLEKTEHTERSKTILRMIMTLAKTLKMEVITEGVETKDQVSFLTENGCDIFQGYYFAKPMPVEDFERAFLNKHIEI